MTSQSEERRAKALELHLAGVSYAEIAKAVGYASKSGAHKAVQEALAAARPEPGVPASLPESQLARLDAMLKGLWPAARRGDVHAVDRVLKIEAERREIEARMALAATVSGPAPAKKETPLDELRDRRARRNSGAKPARRA